MKNTRRIDRPRSMRPYLIKWSYLILSILISSLPAQIISGGGRGGGGTPFGAFTITRTSNTALTIAGCSVGQPCRVTTGDPVNSFTSGGVVNLVTNTGTADIYIDPISAALTVMYGGGTFASGNVTCSGCTAVFQSTPAFPFGSYKIATWTASVSGVWDASGTGFVSYMYAAPVFVGTGGTTVTTSGGTVTINSAASGLPAGLTWVDPLFTITSSNTAGTEFEINNTTGRDISLVNGGSADHPDILAIHDRTSSAFPFAFELLPGNQSFRIASGKGACWSGTADARASCGPVMYSSGGSASPIKFGKGLFDTKAALIFASQTIAGTTFTLSVNTCAATTLVGGASAGSLVSGTSGTCSFTVTIGDSPAATNGWACRANDLTTPADTINQTATTTTTASFSGTTASGDAINFSCVGY